MNSPLPSNSLPDRVSAVALAAFAVFSIFSISLSQLAAAIGGGAWFYRVFRDKSRASQVWPLALPFLLFVLACFVAVAAAVDPGRSFKPLKKLLEILIVFWVANCAVACSPRALGLGDSPLTGGWGAGRVFLLNLMMLAACAAAVYGLGQALATGGVTKFSRVEGTMSIYMTFAGLLMLAGMMVFARLLFAGGMQGWHLAALGLLTLCLLLTLTRQAWLGFIAGTVFLLLARDAKKFLLAAPAVLLVIWLAAPGAVAERLRSFTDLKDETFVTRVELWKGGWQIFKDHPLTGCGFKCVDTVYPQYPQYGMLKRYKGLHNNFLQLAVDTGAIGLLSWCAIWLVFFRDMRRKLRQPAPAGEVRWIERGAVAAVIAFLAGGCFEVNFYDSEVIMLLYFLIGLAYAGEARSVRRDII